jgi:hypothetical protein
MNFVLQRLCDNGNATIGFLNQLLVGNPKPIFHAFTLEDEHRAVKLAGETRIPAGHYELKIRKEDTPLTRKHRTDYGAWFQYHIEITGIPNFTGVYVHVGNDEKHTEGCLLLGDILQNNKIFASNHLQQSTPAVRRFYELVYPHLLAGKKAFLEIRDEHKLQ